MNATELITLWAPTAVVLLAVVIVAIRHGLVVKRLDDLNAVAREYRTTVHTLDALVQHAVARLPKTRARRADADRSDRNSTDGS
jgi:hypothetical protein